MKAPTLFVFVTIFLVVAGLALPLAAGDLTVTFTEPSWDGATVLDGQQCLETVKAVHRVGDEIHPLASAVVEMGTF